MDQESTIHVLNKGFVRLVDWMGSDRAVVDAARVSYGETSKGENKDNALIDYMMRHRHTSPFEQVVFKFHIRLPIFVMRQLVRHRTASLNEISGRYAKLEDDFYMPTRARVRRQDTVNKQGSAEILAPDVADAFMENLNDLNEEVYENFYENFVETHEVAKELARIALPLNIYTEIYWTMDLHNLLHFLGLRMDSHAQWEIRQYANAIAELIEPIVPVSYNAWMEHRYQAKTFSREELAMIKNCLNATELERVIAYSELSKSRIREFREKLGICV